MLSTSQKEKGKKKEYSSDTNIYSLSDKSSDEESEIESSEESELKPCEPIKPKEAENIISMPDEIKKLYREIVEKDPLTLDDALADDEGLFSERLKNIEAFYEKRFITFIKAVAQYYKEKNKQLITAPVMKDLINCRIKIKELNLGGKIVFNPQINVQTSSTPEVMSIDVLTLVLREHYRTNCSMLPKLLSKIEQPIEEAYVPLSIVEQTKEQEEKGEIRDKSSVHDEHRRIDKTLHEVKKPISLEGLFNPDSYQHSPTYSKHPKKEPKEPFKRLLIVGRAGSGKTTLSKNMIYQWAKGDLWPELPAVYWIRLRYWNQPRYRNKEDDLPLAKAIHMYLVAQGKDEIPLPPVEAISNSLKEKKALLILDGFEEVAHLQDVENNLVSRVIAEALAYSRVIITTRPYGIPQGVSFDRTLENIGFSNDCIKVFIHTMAKHYYGDRHQLLTEKSKALHTFLGRRLNLWEIVHIPLNANLLCNLVYHPETEFELTEYVTLTQIYQAIEERLLKHYLKEKRFKGEPAKQAMLAGRSIEALREDCQHELLFLERLAFDGLKTGSPLIEKGLTEKAIRKTRKLSSELKVEKLEKGVSILQWALETDFLENIGESEHKNASFYFIYLSFQEYLAARYLVRGLQQEDKGGDYFQKALKFIEEQKYHQDYRVMLSFVSGLLSINAIDTEALNYFWDAILCGLQDLVGIQKVDLWMSCLEEAKLPGSAEIDTRIVNRDFMLKELGVWVDKWLYAGSAHRLVNILEAFQAALLRHPNLWMNLNLFEIIVNLLKERSDYDFTNNISEKLEVLVSAAPYFDPRNATLMDFLYSNLAKIDEEGCLVIALTLLYLFASYAPGEILANAVLVKALQDLSSHTADIISEVVFNIITKLVINKNPTEFDALFMKYLGEKLIAPSFSGARTGKEELHMYLVKKHLKYIFNEMIKKVPHKILSNEDLIRTLSKGLYCAAIDDKSAKKIVKRYKPKRSILDLLHPKRHFFNVVNDKSSAKKQAYRENSDYAFWLDIKHGQELLNILVKKIPIEVFENTLLKEYLLEGLSNSDAGVRTRALEILEILVPKITIKALRESGLVDKLSTDLILGARYLNIHAVNILKVLVVKLPNSFHANTQLMLGLAEGLVYEDEDEDVCLVSLDILEILIQQMPKKILNDETLLEKLSMKMVDADEDIYKRAIKVFDALLPYDDGTLVDDEFMQGVIAELKEPNSDMQTQAQQVLNVVARIFPKKVFNNTALMQWIYGGLCVENESVDKSIFAVLKGLASNAPQEVYSDPTLKNWLGFAIKIAEHEVSTQALNIIEALLSRMSYRVFDDKLLKDSMNSCILYKHKSHNTYLTKVFEMLALYAPTMILTDEKVMLKFLIYLNEEYMPIRVNALQVLKMLVPHINKKDFHYNDIIESLHLNLQNANSDVYNKSFDVLMEFPKDSQREILSNREFKQWLGLCFFEDEFQLRALTLYELILSNSVDAKFVEESFIKALEEVFLSYFANNKSTAYQHKMWLIQALEILKILIISRAFHISKHPLILNTLIKGLEDDGLDKATFSVLKVLALYVSRSLLINKELMETLKSIYRKNNYNKDNLVDCLSIMLKNIDDKVLMNCNESTMLFLVEVFFTHDGFSVGISPTYISSTITWFKQNSKSLIDFFETEASKAELPLTIYDAARKGGAVVERNKKRPLKKTASKPQKFINMQFMFSPSTKIAIIENQGVEQENKIEEAPVTSRRRGPRTKEIRLFKAIKKFMPVDEDKEELKGTRYEKYSYSIFSYKKGEKFAIKLYPEAELSKESVWIKARKEGSKEKGVVLSSYMKPCS